MGNEKPAAATWGTNPARPTGSGSDGSIAQCNPIDRILPRLEGVKAAGPKKWTARCPSHDDRKASLGLAEAANGTVLLTCRTGCAFAAVVAAVDLKPADLFPDTGRRGGSIRCPKPEPRITRYEYRSADGAHVATKGRKDLPNGDKQPFWELPDGRSGLNGYRIADLPLYRLPELKAADPGDPVLLVEGEKATEAARRLGFTATTCAGGAGQRDFGKALEELAGRIVYLWPDNDAAGRELMDQIAERLEGIAAAVYRLEVPGLPEKGDAADFEAAGRTADELRDLMARAPLYRDYTIAWMRQRLADVEEKATQTDYWRERAIEAETKVEQIERVVADKDLKAEVRTAVGLILHGPEWQAKAGAAGVVQRTYLGYWAERFGESTQTVSKHFKRFAASGWLHFDVDTSDPMKSAAYLALRGTTATEIATPITGSDLKREGDTWGGRRPRCPDHPHAGIKERKVVTCAECDRVLRDKTRIYPPDEPEADEIQDGTREPEAHDHDPTPASEITSSSYVHRRDGWISEADDPEIQDGTRDDDDPVGLFGRLPTDDDEPDPDDPDDATLDWYRRQMADPAEPEPEPDPQPPDPPRPKSPAERIVDAIRMDDGFVKIDGAGRLSWSAASGTPERRAALRDAVRRYQADIIRLILAEGGGT